MNQNQPDVSPDPLREAYDSGRRSGLAISALAMSVVAFISLLGVEKALLGMTLAVLAFRGGRPGVASRRFAAWAIIVNCVYVATIITILVVFRSKFLQLLQLLQKLG